MVNSQDFAKRLHKVLDYYGLSASSFADRIDFNRSSISHLLSGRNKPSLDFVMKVLNEFPEVELYWLLNGKGIFPKKESEELNELAQVKTIDTATYSLSEVEKSKNPSEIKQNQPHSSLNDSLIERIVIFFKDGTYKIYNNS